MCTWDSRVHIVLSEHDFMFLDRIDAGRTLANTLLLSHYQADLVIGIARGGVVVSKVIATSLGIPHTTLIVKKIGSPGNPELAVGAVVQSGQTIDVRDKSVILTDDGIATGETMKAALNWVKSHGVGKVLVAIPVVPSDIFADFKNTVDVVAVSAPADFRSVGEYYKEFPQLTDQDVLKLLP